MTRDCSDVEHVEIIDRSESPELSDALDAAIGDVFDRLMALDGAMQTLADAQVGVVQVLRLSGGVAEAYRNRPERAEELRQLDKLRALASETLAVLARECPVAVETVEGPPARGSSPCLAAPPRARSDTLADCPHALRGAPVDTVTRRPRAGMQQERGADE